MLEQKTFKFPLRVKTTWCFDSPVHTLWTKMVDPRYLTLYGDSLSMEDADIIIVVNDVPQDETCQIKRYLHKTIFLKMEPEWYSEFWKRAQGLLAKWDHSNVGAFNMVEWHLPLNAVELMNMSFQKKYDKVVSSVLSPKRFYPLQDMRLNFAHWAQNYLDWHAFGTEQGGWITYKGSLPDHDKRDALVSYKYSFACENNQQLNYVTEKLYDCILCETLCFYCGAPNTATLVNPLAYVQIDLYAGFETCLNIIQQAIQSDQWVKRLPYIRQAKLDILQKKSLTPRLLELLQRS